MYRRLIPKTKFKAQYRNVSKPATRMKENPERMQSWQIHTYGDTKELKLASVRMPVISRPTDVLVQVQAASVNPIDVDMLHGYGAKVLNLLRKAKNLKTDIEFPLTMGRDFSGVVVGKGHGIRDESLKLGDEVWGVVPVELQGCHATHVVVSHDLVRLRPKMLSYIEAASIPYAGLTAWSALWITGGLCYKTSLPTILNKRILILGGSGGVGTLAIQLAKAWHMQVITTCNSDAVNVLENLGADVVIDYKAEDSDDLIKNEGPYEIILDCANQGPELVRQKGFECGTYITLNSPLLRNVDELGYVGGAFKNLADLLKYNIPLKENKSFVKWGFFAPCSAGMKTLQELVEDGKITPVVKKVYPFEELPRAYERATQGHLRGKLVIDLQSRNE
ncbi:reticulon-4-interacting protein 1, mitochondrial [Fopius arisanus]|uniref:RTN4IP1_0 protein n=2 Tax=Fopius arisanus TaxID=64838 RepID=A0A0C9QZP8_9HYME|nr:PREDICTED: reticulon-4-interacting protein 1, mitochondrial-like [Fopius arisanus]